MICKPRYKGVEYQSIDILKAVLKVQLEREASTKIPRGEQKQYEGLTLNNEMQVAFNLAQEVFKEIGLSPTLDTSQINSTLERLFNKYVEDNLEEFPEEVNALLAAKDKILGINNYEGEIGSAKRHILLYLDIDGTATAKTDTETPLNMATELEIVEGESGTANEDSADTGEGKESDTRGDYQKGYDASAHEIDLTKSFSRQLKLLMGGITNTSRHSKGKRFTGFMNLKEYLDPETVIMVLQDLLADSRNDMPTLRRKIQEKIDSSPDTYGFLQEVLDRIEAQPTHIQNELLNKFNSTLVSMRFIMRSFKYDGSVMAQMLDADSRSPKLKIKNEFFTNFKQAKFINLEEDNMFTLKLPEAKKYLRRLEDLKNKALSGRVTPQEAVDVLSQIGLSLHPNTVEDLISGKVGVNGVSFSSMFEPKLGLFGEIIRNLTAAIEETEDAPKKTLKIPLNRMAYVGPKNNKVGHILGFNTNNFLNTIIEVESRHRLPFSGSKYVGGKTIFNYAAPSLTKTIYSELMDSVGEYHRSGATRKEVKGKLRELLSMTINGGGVISDFDPDDENNPKLNFFLDNLLKYPQALEEFAIHTISPESFKTKDADGGYTDSDQLKISDLSPGDYLQVLAGFFNDKGATIKTSAEEVDDFGGIPLRMAQMFFPTMSDASDMYLATTPVVDVTSTYVLSDSTRVTGLTSRVTQHVADQLIYPEVYRMIGYLKEKAANPDFILNSIQNTASNLFWDFEGLNTEMVTNPDTGLEITLVEYIHHLINTNSQKTPNEISAVIKEALNETFLNYTEQLIFFEKEKLLKISKDGTVSGEWLDKGIVSGETAEDLINTNLDTSYLESRLPEEEETDGANPEGSLGLDIAALDFTVNSLVFQANSQKVFAADLTNYAPETNKFYFDSEGNIVITDPNYAGTTPADRRRYLTDTIAQMAAKLSDNRAKRLKGLLSPGLKNANSYSEDYIQLFMQDIEDSSENLEFLLKLHYKDSYTERDIELMKALRNIEDHYEVEDSKSNPDPRKLKDMRKKIKEFSGVLEKKFPKLSGFIDLTGTDAQEYTTWREHFKILMDKGRLEGKFSQEEIYEVYKKLNDYEQSDYKGTLKLTEKDKQIIFQPLKPLHAGSYADPQPGGFVNNLFVYVKSSSFPLIPGLTANTKMDNIRKNLEALEKLHKKPVRASYGSANKVGGTLQAVSSNELAAGEMSPDRLDAISKTSTRVLSRKYFSIQNDKTFKAQDNLEKGKRNEVVRGVQLERTILSNGINRITDKIFKNFGISPTMLRKYGVEVGEDGKLSGEDLYKIYNGLYQDEQQIKSLVVARKFNSLDGNWNQSVETLEKLRKALLKEVKNNPQALESLEILYTIEDENGTPIEVDKKTYEASNQKAKSGRFKVPLWLNNNILTIENALNSIFTNNLAKQKLPGVASPVASSNKFESKNPEDMSATEISDVVYLPGYEGGKLQYTFDPETGEHRSQVLVSAKFPYRKDTGRVDADGDPIYENAYLDLTDPAYHTVVNGRRVLKQDKIPAEALLNISFRTPYSDLGSGVLIEIVGFLPYNSGDLMIVPKEHTAQLGEDYDIDVRTVYNYNLETVRNSNGEVSVRRLRNRSKDSFFKGGVENVQGKYEDLRTKVIAQAEQKQEEYKAIRAEVVAEIKILRRRKEELKKLLKEDPEISEDLIDELALIKEELAYLDSVVFKEEYRAATERVNLEKNKLLAELDLGENTEVENVLNSVSRLSQYEAHQLKIIENNIIDVYQAVYRATDQEIQSYIHKELSISVAKNTVAKMQEAREEAARDAEEISLASDNQSNEELDPIDKDRPERRFRTMHSALTQMSIMLAGHVGKLGIGKHSLWVTYHNLLQQVAGSEGIPINFGTISKNIIIGRIQFSPTLGRKNTIQTRGNTPRTITEVNTENQNISMDNQRELLMAERNENEFTIDAFALLCNMGIDTDAIMENGEFTDTQVQIPSLIISQPIIKRFVELKMQYKNVDAGYMSDSDIFQILYQELAQNTTRDISMYSTGQSTVVNSRGQESSVATDLNFPELTAENLLAWEATETGTDYSFHQAQVLYLFQTAFIQAKEITKHQSMLRIGSNGFDKSFFKSTYAKNFFLDLFNSPNKSLEGIVEKLYGEFSQELIPAKDFDKEKIRLRKEGYYIVNTTPTVLNGEEAFQVLYVKPSNFAATKSFSVYSAVQEFMGNILPFQEEPIQELLTKIAGQSRLALRKEKDGGFSAVDLFSGKGLEMVYKIMSGVRTYLGTNPRSDFYKSGDIQRERQRLLYKETSSTGEELPSLPGYLNELRANPEWGFLFEQPFFRNLEFNLTEKQTPDHIRYHADKKSGIENENTYKYLRMLFADDSTTLPPFKGDNNYTYRELILDLARYAALAGDTSGALGFKTHVPMEVYESSNYNTILRLFDNVLTEEGANRARINENLSYTFGGSLSRLGRLIGNIELEDLIAGTPEMPGVSDISKFSPEKQAELQKLVLGLNKVYNKEIFTISDGKIYSTGFGGVSVVTDVFRDQFLRHNPEYIPYVQTTEILKDSVEKEVFEDREEPIDIEDVISFTLSSAQEAKLNAQGLDYLVFTGENIFRRVPGTSTFMHVDKLGMSGSAEYNVSTSHTNSNILANIAWRLSEAELEAITDSSEDSTGDLVDVSPEELNSLSSLEEHEGDWTREEVEKNTEKVYFFPDNTQDAGSGFVPSAGQAVIRGLKNAFGFVFKRDRKNNLPPDRTKLSKSQIISKLREAQNQVQGRNQDESKYLVNNEEYSRVTSVLRGETEEDLEFSAKYYSSRNAGNAIDFFMRRYLQGDSVENILTSEFEAETETVGPDGKNTKRTTTISEFISGDILEELTSIFDQVKQDAQKNNLEIFTENLVLFNPDSKVAGELDLLLLGEDGTVRIYDLKALKSFQNFRKKYGNEPSKETRYSEQLTAYQLLFENMFPGNPVSGLEIIPIEVNYDEIGKLRKTKKLQNKKIVKQQGLEIKILGTAQENKGSFLTDADFAEFKAHVDSQIQKALDSEKTIVLPKDFGQDLKTLKEKAPKLYEYFTEEIAKLRESLEEQPVKKVVQTLSDSDAGVKKLKDASRDRQAERIMDEADLYKNSSKIAPGITVRYISTRSRKETTGKITSIKRDSQGNIDSFMTDKGDTVTTSLAMFTTYLETEYQKIIQEEEARYNKELAEYLENLKKEVSDNGRVKIKYTKGREFLVDLDMNVFNLDGTPAENLTDDDLDQIELVADVTRERIAKEGPKKEKGTVKVGTSPGTTEFNLEALEGAPDGERRELILEAVSQDPNARALIEDLFNLEAFGETTPAVKILPSLGGGNAGYLRAGKRAVIGGEVFHGPLILLSSEFFNDPLIDPKTKATVLAEELVHKATSDFISEYISDAAFGSDGKLTYTENISPLPESVKFAIDLYNQGAEAMIEDIMKEENLSREQAILRMQKLIGSFDPNTLYTSSSETERNLRNRLYRFIDLDEFIAGITTDEDFRTQMEGHTYKGKTFRENILELLKELFQDLINFKSAPGETLTLSDAGLAALVSLVEDSKNQRPGGTVNLDTEGLEGLEHLGSLNNQDFRRVESIMSSMEFITPSLLRDLNIEGYTPLVKGLVDRIKRKC